MRGYWLNRPFTRRAAVMDGNTLYGLHAWNGATPTIYTSGMTIDAYSNNRRRGRIPNGETCAVTVPWLLIDDGACEPLDAADLPLAAD